jgi:hypothetical protein
VNEYVPSAIVPKVHADEAVALSTVHVYVTPVAEVAVITTRDPDTTDPTLIVGVLSEVILSVLDVPKSEPAARVGVPVGTVHCA